MNPPKVDELGYIQFLIASHGRVSATEAARPHPAAEDGPAPDAYTRLLYRTTSDGTALWDEVQPLVDQQVGLLVLEIAHWINRMRKRWKELVTYHWSGKPGEVVKGINLLSLRWTDGDARVPCDLRIYNKAEDGLSKHDHFRHRLHAAPPRGFAPDGVAFASWYASLDNLKVRRAIGWAWLTRLKKNRLVNPDGEGNRQLQAIAIPTPGRQVHLKGYGWVKVFRTDGQNGSAAYWATSDLTLTLEQRAVYALDAWQIESYHRGLKQFTGIEQSQHRNATPQRNPTGLAIRAFVRLELHRLRTGVSWLEAKTCLIRDAISAYLQQPHYTLAPSTNCVSPIGMTCD